MASGGITGSEFIELLSASLAALLPEFEEKATFCLCMDWHYIAERFETAGCHALESKNVYVRCMTNAGVAASTARTTSSFGFKRGSNGHQTTSRLAAWANTAALAGDLRSYAGVNRLAKNEARPPSNAGREIYHALRDAWRDREKVYPA